MSKRERSSAQETSPADVGAGQGAGDAESARRGLMSVNGLTYTIPPDLSVVTERSNKNSFFAHNEYTAGQNMTCICNTGAQYILGRRSFMRFDIKNNSSTEPMGFGVGSVLNLFRDVTITSRSGDDAERVFYCNRISTPMVRMTHSREWVKTVGKLAGFTTNQRLFEYEGRSYTNAELVAGATTDESMFSTRRVDQQPRSAQFWDHTDTASSTCPIDQRINGADYGFHIPPGGIRRVVVPLSLFTGLFQFDKLLPPPLMSGLRIDIRLESANIAFTALRVTGQAEAYPTNVALDYSILNPVITFDSYKLTDAIERVINEESAMRGLEIPFTSIYTTVTNYSSEGGQVQNIECRKAVSRALCLSVIQEFQRNEARDAYFDNFQTLPFDFTSWQVRIGSLYLPQQRITGSKVAETYGETYHHTLRSLGKLLSNNSSSVHLEEWTGSINGNIRSPNDTFNKATYEHAKHKSLRKYEGQSTTDRTKAMNMISVDLERSNVQRLSGIPINNSRVAEWIATSSANRERSVYLALKRVRVIRVFLQNLEIEE